ncbi:hypothetical protein EPUL_002241, partial [Erysiphe pulchra]
MKTLKRNPIGNQNNDPLNPPATAQIQPAAASINHLARNMYRSIYRNSHYSNPQNLHSLHKRNPPQGGLEISGARCRLIKYNKQHLLNARHEVCIRPPTQSSRKAVIYYPKNPGKYSGSPPFFLYPLGKHLFITKSGPHYGIDRVVIDTNCNIVGVLIEWPKPSELLKKT